MPNGVVEFLTYALQGFVDGLSEQLSVIRRQILRDTWTTYVHTQFHDRKGFANTRRRNLVLDLSDVNGPVPARDIRTLTPRLAEAYLNKTNKTITRDINVLKTMGLVRQTREGIEPTVDMMLAFLPVTGPPSE